MNRSSYNGATLNGSPPVSLPSVLGRGGGFNAAAFNHATFDGVTRTFPLRYGLAFNGGTFGSALFNGPGLAPPITVPSVGYITAQQAIIMRLLGGLGIPPAGVSKVPWHLFLNRVA